MSNALGAVLERLRQEALATPQRVFDASRARQPALASHADVASVLAMLADEREHMYPARDALTRALLVEHRAGGTPLWASVLLVAYCPMLCRLRGRLRSDVVPGDELDQLVLTSFLATLSELPLRENVDRLPMRLRQRTQRQVFGFLRKERAQWHGDIDVDELEDVDPEPLASQWLSTDEKLYDVALFLQRAAEEGVPQSDLAAFAATMFRQELLRSYVERVGPDDDLGRERLYQRLKRQRTRLLRRLRTMMTEVPPQLLASGF